MDAKGRSRPDVFEQRERLSRKMIWTLLLNHTWFTTVNQQQTDREGQFSIIPLFQELLLMKNCQSKRPGSHFSRTIL